MSRAIKPIILFLIASLMLNFLTLQALSAEEMNHVFQKRGPAVDRIIFKKVDQDLAPKFIEKGEIDIYLYGLKITTAKEYMRSQLVKIYQAPSTMISILLNPAPAREGELNPFSIREVRFAINYLINRDYIAKSIYGGFAIPMHSHVSSLDFDYLIISDTIREYRISYDFEYASMIIRKALEERGARLIDGKWTFNGKPIELRFVIRVEDERREIGSMLAEELEKLGFIVRRIYVDFAQAMSLIYRTDPRAFEWHLYTEGWGRGAAERYDYATINQMCAPWLGYMPGWLEYGFWQYTNHTIDELGKRIFMGDYADLNERNKLYKEMTKLCMEEAIRMWVVTVNTPLAYSPNLRDLSLDIVSGLRSLWTLRSTYSNKNELVVGHLWVRPYIGSAWNPVGGFTDIYSVDIWRQLHDPSIVRDPSTGMPKPFRASYRVIESKPTSEVEVSRDAFIWSSEEGRWVRVKPGTKVKSVVLFNYAKYIGSRWHHGMEITMADLLYSLYHSFDMVYNPEKSRVEVALAATRKPILETFKGFRLVNETAIEVYVDYWNPIADYVAEYAEPWGAVMPWELLHAMDVMVFEERLAAYSDTAAVRLQVDWLDLIETKQCRRLVGIIEKLHREGRYPHEVFNLDGRTFETLENVLRRYEALIKWYRVHDHLVISNGAFYLMSIGSVAEQYAELKAFRDETYPFTPRDFYVGVPKKIELYAPTFLKVVRGEEVTFDAELKGVHEASLRVILLDPVAQDILYRDELKIKEGKFKISMPPEISAKLDRTHYQIRVIAFSDFTSLIFEGIIELSITEKVEEMTKIYEREEIGRTEVTVTEPKGIIEIPLILMTLLVAAIAASILTIILRKKIAKKWHALKLRLLSFSAIELPRLS